MLFTSYNRTDRQTDRQTDKHNCALFVCQDKYCKYKPSGWTGGSLCCSAMPFGWFFALLDKVFRKAREPCPVPYRQLE